MNNPRKSNSFVLLSPNKLVPLWLPNVKDRCYRRNAKYKQDSQSEGFFFNSRVHTIPKKGNNLNVHQLVDR